MALNVIEYNSSFKRFCIKVTCTIWLSCFNNKCNILPTSLVDMLAYFMAYK